MGRPPCCDRSNVKRGPWTAEEDAKILAYVATHGIGNWTNVPKKAGLNRCGKSCRLRWTNYLRPDLKHDSFTPQEEELIINYHKAIGSRWSVIAQHLPGRTDNDVKNYWNTKLKKKLADMGIDPITHRPFSQILTDLGKIGRLTNPDQADFFPRNIIGSPSSSVVTHQTHEKGAWDLHSQTMNNAPMQKRFLNEMPASSSSSSTTQQTRANQPIQSSPFVWSDYLAEAVAPKADVSGSFGLVEKKESQEYVRYAYDLGNFKHVDVSSSLSSSFIEGIVDKDEEIRSQFPEIVESSFDYSHDF